MGLFENNNNAIAIKDACTLQYRELIMATAATSTTAMHTTNKMTIIAAINAKKQKGQ